MKKYTNTIVAIVLAGTFLGCTNGHYVKSVGTNNSTNHSNSTIKWKKDFYDTGVMVSYRQEDTPIINLKNEIVANSSQKVEFSIRKVHLTAYKENPNIRHDGLVKIENGVLKFVGNTMGTGTHETVEVTVSATANGKSSDTKIKFEFLLPIG